jgi:hypothetical protein
MKVVLVIKVIERRNLSWVGLQHIAMNKKMSESVLFVPFS